VQKLMVEKEKLQKAIEATIAAGYQLSSEAFEFLCSGLTTEDPQSLMHRALQKAEGLNEKPMFIRRTFLEEVIHPPDTVSLEESQSIVQPAVASPPTDPNYASEGTAVFHPYAKEIEAQTKIIEDPTTKLSSNGTIEDYLHYFQDRFKKIERLLRQRIDVKASTPIREALKSQPKAKLKIICMISEKRESKQNTILTVEDLEASATVLVTHNAKEELRRKAQTLLADQVVCLAVVKTRSRLFLAEDIIFPEVGQKIQHKASEPVFAVLTSDLHVGSTKFQKEAFRRFILWINGKYGNERMREIAGHVKYVLAAGDIVDGIGIYPNQAKELAIRDITKQYKFASKIIERIPEYIEVIVSPGNHDAPRKALPQPAIAKDLLGSLKEGREIHSVGDPSTVSIHGVEILMYHGRSLDDIIANIPGMDPHQPEKAMKLLLQSRHLAPLYGGKTLLSPESRDMLVIERVPDIFHAGHIHVLGYCNHRGVLVINSGAWQEQTDYMEKLGVMPTPGKVPVVNLQTLETTILSFS